MAKDSDNNDLDVKVVSFNKKKQENQELEEGCYVNPQLIPIIDYIGAFVEAVGCSEIQVILLDSDMNADIVGTDDVSTTMLGVINQLNLRYAHHLEDSLAEV